MAGRGPVVPQLPAGGHRLTYSADEAVTRLKIFIYIYRFVNQEVLVHTNMKCTIYSNVLINCFLKSYHQLSYIQIKLCKYESVRNEYISRSRRNFVYLNYECTYRQLFFIYAHIKASDH